MNLKKQLEHQPIQISVPCRVDFGGTLDISTLFLPLQHMAPSSFNIALDLRTTICLLPWQEGFIKVSSRGFKTAVFKKDEIPFDHPLGLMFACANYFDVHGVHIKIKSASPPRSALGGSSAAAVAILAAFYTALGMPADPRQIAFLAHYIEASVAGVPCGLQDQLAAAFGGINQWIWKMGKISPEFERIRIFEHKDDIMALNSNILVAYCGIPHVSKDINKQWVDSFIAGKTRLVFKKIAELTKKFSMAVKTLNLLQAADLMNQETRLRLEMTPDVLDNAGKILFEKAMSCDCGARFTGAGGGGCIWAIGMAPDIERLKPFWQEILSNVKDATILDTKIETRGIIIH